MNTESQTKIIPWKNFVNFLNESYQNFIPRNPRLQNQQEDKLVIHRETAKLILKTTSEDWREFLDSIESENFQITKDFLAPFMGKNRKEFPPQLKENFNHNIKKITEYAEYALINEPDKDLV